MSYCLFQVLRTRHTEQANSAMNMKVVHPRSIGACFAVSVVCGPRGEMNPGSERDGLQLVDLLTESLVN